MNPFQVVRDFEAALCEYTGAPYAVCVNSCTNALFLACKWCGVDTVKSVEIPRFTYVGVAQSIINAGGRVTFRDEDWRGEYQLKPFELWDAARRFTSGMYHGGYQAVSFHISKILGLDQGGCILHDSKEADRWFRRARFDGRTEGVPPRDDDFIQGWHMYMSPPIAAQGIWRLNCLPKHNADLPNSDYPDLSKVPLFQSQAEKSADTFPHMWLRILGQTTVGTSTMPGA